MVNKIMEKDADYRRLFVGNLVDMSFEYMNQDVLPGYLTYLFGGSKGGTRFGDDNGLADALSDTFLIVGGGKQTFDQLDGALKAGKPVHIVASREGNVHDRNRLSAGDIVVEAKKLWKGTPILDQGLDKGFRSNAYDLLSQLGVKFDEDLERIVGYLATWRERGYLETLVTFEEV